MNAHDILFYGDRTLLTTMDRIPASERTRGGLIGWWSAREAMAHLAIFETLLAELLESFIRGTPPPELITRMNPELNDVLVAEKEGKTFDELLNEYQTSFQRVMQLVPQISPERWREVGTLPWYGNEYSLEDYVVYTYYGHKREHAARFEAFGDQLYTERQQVGAKS